MLNKLVECVYAGKARRGVVIEEAAAWFTIEYTGENGKREFRRFTKTKCEELRIVG